MPPSIAAQRTRKSVQASSDPQPMRWAGWIAIAGLWAFFVLALASFSSADPPSHVVAVHNQDIANLCGQVGAAVAYWALHVMGLGAWILAVAAGSLIVLRLFGRQLSHLPLRLAGVLLVAVCIPALHALLLPTWGGLAGAPGGVLGHAIDGVLTPRLGGFGAGLCLFILLMVGAIIAADELVVAAPGVIWRRVSIWRQHTPRPSLHWIKRLSLRPEGTAVLDKEAPEDDVTWEDQYEEEEEDEYEDDEDEDDEYDYEEDEYEYEEEEEPEEEPTPAPKLSKADRKKKLDSLRVKIFGGSKNVAKDEDIHRKEFEGYEFPSVELLAEPEGDYSKKAENMVRKQAESLESALTTFSIDAEVTGIESGPTVTLYSVQLAPGTRVARLNTIASDLARSLGAQNIRIIPNMAGRTTVGIEVPNPSREKVRLRELISSGAAEGMTLPMFLGKDASGEPLVEDLAKMPHMLVAGTTGSGKSVCINTIIMSWLFLKRPDELKLILVDPKMVELSMFGDIPHLACPVVTEMNRAAAILDWAVRKMEERYEILNQADVRDIGSYNSLTEEEKIERFDPQNDLEEAKIPKSMPYIVFIIDELADLMMTNKEVEQAIVRIAQKARAVGIHLILATQRPQANVVTGLIKSNMPCRISFKVASGMDSRIVLDAKGAELLLGQGAMMLVPPRNPEVRRAQGTLVDDGEGRKVVRFLKDVAKPSFERTLIQLRPGTDGEVGGAPVDRDPLFDDAVRTLIETGRGSVSLIQRRLSIGYSRASRLVDQMGQAGILGEHKGSVAREVLITMEEWDQMQAMEAGTEDGQAANENTVDGEYTYEYDYDEDPDELDGDPVPDEVAGEYRQ